MTDDYIDYDSVAEIYDLYVRTGYDIPFFLSEAATVAGPVVELTAGTGRVSLPLIQAGVRLTCVDVSRAMLEVLRRKLRDRGLKAGIVAADVSRLPLGAAFDLAIFPFQAFMEIVGERRQRAVLAAVFGCLKPGGRFVCTLHNPAVRRAQTDGVLREVGRFDVPDGMLVVSGIERGGEPVVEREQFFEFFGVDGQLRARRRLAMRFEFVERERLERMAREAGFEVERLHGGYDRSDYDPAGSPVMIFVFRKKQVLPTRT
jgi:SAM-dependent methyltransferase